MKNIIIFTLLVGFVLAVYGGFVFWANQAEEAPYKVVKQLGPHIQVREYAPMVLAQVTLDEPFEAAGNNAFRILFKYIDGANTAQSKIAMTAPVVQQQTQGQKISMTSPVLQQTTPNGWQVAFVLPKNFTLETAPAPTDARVKLIAVPARKMAVLRFSGSWSDQAFNDKAQQLMAELEKQNIGFSPNVEIARYNPPFMPPFLRRNEVLLELE